MLGFNRKLREVGLTEEDEEEEIGEVEALVVVEVEVERAGRRRKGSSAEGELAVDLSDGALGGSWLGVSAIDEREGRVCCC